MYQSYHFIVNLLEELSKHSLRSDETLSTSNIDTSNINTLLSINTSNTLQINQFKNETFQSYTLCEQKNSKTTCYMIPIYIAKGTCMSVRK